MQFVGLNVTVTPRLSRDGCEIASRWMLHGNTTQAICTRSRSYRRKLHWVHTGGTQANDAIRKAFGKSVVRRNKKKSCHSGQYLPKLFIQSGTASGTDTPATF
jgi:hypothetical protein